MDANTRDIAVGVVVIGRNEGARLQRCLNSIKKQADVIVYVDSGSTDNSIAFAKAIGVDVVELDIRLPFSAGRARNEGFQHLTRIHPQLEYIQFIDGDCELYERWLEFAFEFLKVNPQYAIVSGRRKEMFPEKSVYNLLCDIEWDTPIGETNACGGDFMIKKNAFDEVNGFNPKVIAGEEPELCYRVKKNNWSIYRVDHLMTHHDSNILYFSQWFKRAMRTGHAYAQGYALHQKDGDKYCFKESARCWFWAFLFPALTILLSLFIDLYFFLFLFFYIAQFLKIFFVKYNKIRLFKRSIFYSFFTVISKWPQLCGQLLFLQRSLFRNNYSIIEYQ